MKEKELRQLVESLRPTKSELWGDGLGMIILPCLGVLPAFFVEGEMLLWILTSWGLLLIWNGGSCFGRFLSNDRLRKTLDSELARIDGLQDPHAREARLAEFLNRDIGTLLRVKPKVR